jgi:hypothetical protein
MANDTHQHSKENKTIISFKNSFWLVIIIVGLFIAALNFVKSESGGEKEGGESNTITQPQPDSPKVQVNSSDSALKASNFKSPETK